MFLLVGAIAKNRGLGQELVLVRKNMKINKQRNYSGLESTLWGMQKVCHSSGGKGVRLKT